MSKITKSTTNPAPGSNSQRTNLFITVRTFSADTGKEVGYRCVDLYHFGTSAWMRKHEWWAMHNGAEIEIKAATQPEIDKCLEEGRKALAEKFNGAPSAAAEEPAKKAA